MKKLFFILLLFKGCVAFGQVKIGNITIDSQTAKEYFADCYFHPDTVNAGSITECYPNTSFILTDEISACIEKVKELNKEIRNKSIGEVWDTVYYPAGVDTLQDVFLFDKIKFDSTFKMNGNKVTYQYEAFSYPVFKGYLIVRKPSEDDFIKWQFKNKNK